MKSLRQKTLAVH